MTATGVEKVHALLNPRNVVIAGASDRPGNWAERARRNLEKYGFAGRIYPLSPTRDEVWGQTCYRDFNALPEPPDHVVVVVPARFVAATLRDAAAAGARSANVFSSGFDEAPGEEGSALAAELRAVIEETGIAVCGPNCMGNFYQPSNVFTLTDDRPHDFAPGPVALFGQSGGIVMAMKRGLEERGLVCSGLVTSGNETGLTSADYISYFAEQDHIKVIVCYEESVRDPEAFLSACRKARAAAKPVVVMKLGASDAGRQAAAAHTGRLAGSLEAFDAVAGAAGAVRVRNLDDVVEAVEYLVHTPLPKGDRLAAMTFSGGMRGLLLDCAHLNGLQFPSLQQATLDRLESICGVGTILGNPLDAGFTALSSNKAYLECVETLLADPNIDAVLLQEEVPRHPGSDRKIVNLRNVNELAPKAGKPVAFMSMISYGQSAYSNELRKQFPNLSFMQEVDKTLRVMRSLATYARHSAMTEAPPPAPLDAGVMLVRKHLAASGPDSLDEIGSKQLLATYGIAVPKEELARDEEAAVAAAQRIGYPVVAKVVSAAIPHKSDMGGVMVGLKNDAAVRAAYRSICDAVAALPDSPAMDGVLIAEMVSGQLECVLGATRDPEVGPVILFGSGGVDLELTPDVALSAPVFTGDEALALVDRTRAGRLSRGYRGRPALDRQALAQAIIGLSRLVHDGGDAVQSIDINPFLLREHGAVALDGLIILQRGIEV
ncbi:MAG: acetate--CoA ligase family protein [Hyphomicrobiales bacterium]|nr:acetate--CoA ligase family protein [Hyphomicrobiales bacterium]